MQLQRDYKKELIYSLLLFLLLLSVVVSVLFYQYNQRKTRTQQRMLQTEYNLIKASALSLHYIANNTYRLTIDKPEIARLLEQASKDPQSNTKIRQKLYKKLLPVYRELTHYNIKQFQFFLPNGINFLRFHKPDKYSDSLKQIRYSLEVVEKTLKPVYGFEEARTTNGYRNIYPMFYNDHFVGSVEISYSMDALTRILRHIHHAYYGLLVKKDLVQNVVWKEYQSHYVPSLISEQYFLDNDVLSTILSKDPKFSREEFRELEYKIKDNIKPLLGKKEHILTPVEIKGHEYVLMFFRIKDIKGDVAAYIISLREDNYFRELKQTFQWLFVILTLFSIIISFLFFLFLKKQYDLTYSLQKQSFIDPLTSLLNRRGFDTYVTPVISMLKRDKKSYCILFLDIDFFKKVNDNYGHDIGDIVLQELAQILLTSFRESDLVARWGGEEFIVMLNDCNIDEAIEKAEQLRQRVENFKKKNLPRFTISIGVQQATPSDSLENVIKQADDLLYTAKENGRNRIESNEL